jgi:hypothetical protein
MRKPQHGTPKRQGGISLIPALWAEIDRVAAAAGVSRNQVMERALMATFGVASDLRKTGSGTRKTEEAEVVSLP